MSVGEEDGPLPNGWRWARLGEVATIVSGSTPSSHDPSFWGGEITWVTPTDLGRLRSREIVASERRITEAGFASCATTMLPVNSIVMSSRAPIGHLGIASVPICTNQGCKSFVPNGDVESRFLFWAMKQMMPRIVALGAGNTFAEVSKTTLGQVEFLLPPFSEQRRIADRLDAAMDQQARARELAVNQLAAIDALPAALLSAAFRGEL